MARLTMEESAAKVDSLPQWAQRYIRNLEQSRDAALRRAREAEATLGLDEDRILRIRPNQRFGMLGQERDFDVIEGHFLPDGTLDVSQIDIAVRPEAGNRVVIFDGGRRQ